MKIHGVHSCLYCNNFYLIEVCGHNSAHALHTDAHDGTHAIEHRLGESGRQSALSLYGNHIYVHMFHKPG